MTIQEAIKSGRPFRRPKQVRDWPSLWLFSANGSICILCEEPPSPAHVSVMDLLADDWELKNQLWPEDEFYLAPLTHDSTGPQSKAIILSKNAVGLQNYKGLVKVKIVEDEKWIKQ